MNLLLHLTEQKLISPPAWLLANTMYLTIMGSHAYGVADTTAGETSDLDVYGFCIPPREIVFPHLAGEVWGFGKFKEGMPQSWFGQYQQHHVLDPSALGGKGREHDLQIYNIVKYVQLCMECKHSRRSGASHFRRPDGPEAEGNLPSLTRWPGQMVRCATVGTGRGVMTFAGLAGRLGLRSVALRASSWEPLPQRSNHVF